MASFFILDTSPLFRYSPCVDCTDTNAWTAAYATGGLNGGDRTFHIAGSSTSSAAINLTATSLNLQTSTGCSAFQVSLNGSAAVGGCDSSLQKLPPGSHRIVLQPAGSGPISLYGISGSWNESGRSQSLSNQTVDDGEQFTFTGEWEHVADDSSDFGSIRDYHGKTLSGGMSSGAEASMIFNGAAVYVYGWAGQGGATADVSVDGILQNSINTTSPWRDSNALLYFGSGFDASASHTLTIQQTSAGRIGLDYALISSPTAAGISTVGLVCAIAVPVLAILATGVGIYIYLEYRRSGPSVASHPPYPFGGFGGAKSPSAKSAPIVYTINRASQVWAGKDVPSLARTSNADRDVRRDRNSYFAFKSASPGAYTGVASPQSSRGGGRHNEAILDSYLPKTGSTNSMPSAGQADSSSPHSFGTTVASPVSAYTTPLSHRDRTRRPPLLRQSTDPNRSKGRGSTESIALEHTPLSALYTPDSGNEPPSALLAKTFHAHQARRSTARVYERASDFLPLTLHPRLSEGAESPSSPSRLRYLQPEVSPSPAARLHVPSSPPSAGLRRGVSVKSVKTSRSFFSELFTNPPALPAPSAGSSIIHHPSPRTPLSTSRRISEPYPQSVSDNLSTARPDSSLFPVSRSSSLVRSQHKGRIGTQVSPLRFSAFEPFSASYLQLPDEGRDRDRGKDWIIELNEGDGESGSSRPPSAWTEARRGGRI